jgi:hypothetical protein
MPEGFDLGAAYDALEGGQEVDLGDGASIATQPEEGQTQEAAPEPQVVVTEGEEDGAVPTDGDVVDPAPPDGGEPPADIPDASPVWFNEIDQALAMGGVNAPAPAPAPPPQQYDPNAGYYQPPPQAPPQQPQNDPRQDIDRLFQDPRAFIAEASRTGMEPIAAQYAGQARMEIERMRHANTTNAMHSVRTGLEKNYSEVLNKDNSFKSNEDVKGLVEGTLRTMSMQAANAAYGGNYAPVRVFENPKFYAAILAGAKAMAGVPDVNPEPAVPRGHAPSRVAPQQDTGNARVNLPPDLEEVAREVGSEAYRRELEEAYAEAQKHGDISWR